MSEEVENFNEILIQNRRDVEARRRELYAIEGRFVSAARMNHLRNTVQQALNNER